VGVGVGFGAVTTRVGDATGPLWLLGCPRSNTPADDSPKIPAAATTTAHVRKTAQTRAVTGTRRR
jgi:hypothetical protein